MITLPCLCSRNLVDFIKNGEGWRETSSRVFSSTSFNNPAKKQEETEMGNNGDEKTARL